MTSLLRVLCSFKSLTLSYACFCSQLAAPCRCSSTRYMYSWVVCFVLIMDVEVQAEEEDD